MTRVVDEEQRSEQTKINWTKMASAYISVLCHSDQCTPLCGQRWSKGPIRKPQLVADENTGTDIDMLSQYFNDGLVLCSRYYSFKL